MLSIVSTLYYSEPHIKEFYGRVVKVAEQLGVDNFEIILVNDGSPDNAFETALELHHVDRRLVLIDLSKNFGHHRAIMTGLAHASGDNVFLIDCDLEEKPEWLIEFSNLLEKEKADVVFGRQKVRRGNLCEIWLGNVYYAVFKWLSKLEHPKNVVTARLMTRQYVEALLEHRERELVFSCLCVITGFKQIPIFVKKTINSPSTYTLGKKAHHSVNAIISFSDFPLVLIFYLGLTISSCALIYALTLTIGALFFYTPVSGWTSLMVSIWMLGGTIILSLGLVGIYVSKVFIETKQRPYSIIKKIYKHPKVTQSNN